MLKLEFNLLKSKERVMKKINAVAGEEDNNNIKEFLM